MTLGPKLLAGAAAVVSLTACTSRSGEPPQGRASLDPTTTTTTTATSATDDGNCRAGGHPSAYEDSAECLYVAFLADDRDLADSYASPSAVAEMFELGGFPTDSDWEFEGCGEPRETQPSSGVACHYRIPGDVHGVSVELEMREDLLVERVQSIG